jgi:hypothetical protein
MVKKRSCSIVVEQTDESKLIKTILQQRSKNNKQASSSDLFSYFLLFLVILTTILTYPTKWDDKVTVNHVWYYGWITAVSTGAGVLPFLFVNELEKYWMGVSNGFFLMLL